MQMTQMVCVNSRAWVVRHDERHEVRVDPHQAKAEHQPEDGHLIHLQILNALSHSKLNKRLIQPLFARMS